MLLDFLKRFSGAAPIPSASVPADTMTARSSEIVSAPVHVLADDGLVRLDGGLLHLRTETNHPMRLRLGEVSQLSLHGEAGLTTPALRALMERGIPVVYRSRSGHYCGQTIDLSGQLSAVRRAHYTAAADVKRSLAIARTLVAAKIVNSRGVLRRRHGADGGVSARLAALVRKAEAAGSLESLRGIEGTAAALFFAALPDMIVEAKRRHFPFNGRRRRPPADNVNALLSYLYAVLVGECAVAALGAGLDPNVGFLHAERSGRPALALDMVEPLRPLIADSLALSLINRNEIAPADFCTGTDGVRLTDSGRRVVLAALEQRLALPWANEEAREIDCRSAISGEAAALAGALRRNAPFECRLRRG